MEKLNLNENEKAARALTGIESDSINVSVNDENANDKLKTEAINDFSEKVDSYTEKLSEHNGKLVKEASKFDITNLEMLPLFDYVLVSPYEVNPFQRIITDEGGLILDNAGNTPTYKSNETGETEEEEQFVKVGVVMEVGNECKYLKVGDTVMWLKVSEVPIPFYRQGFKLLNEKRILVVINENLKERLKNE